MEKLLFDSSSHLGQFCLNDEAIRIGCKNMQVDLASRPAFDHAGAWIDSENGRVDRLIWSLPQEVQAAYYPFMDHFFSVASIQQAQMAEDVEKIAWQLRSKLPNLSLYSRLSLATAIIQGRQRIYTLFSELLSSQVKNWMVDEYGIDIALPQAKEEAVYPNAELEDKYQKALVTFRSSGVNLLKRMEDKRVITI